MASKFLCAYHRWPLDLSKSVFVLRVKGMMFVTMLRVYFAGFGGDMGGHRPVPKSMHCLHWLLKCNKYTKKKKQTQWIPWDPLLSAALVLYLEILAWCLPSFVGRERRGCYLPRKETQINFRECLKLLAVTSASVWGSCRAASIELRTKAWG